MTGWTGALLEGILTFALVVAYFRAFVDRKADPAVGATHAGADRRRGVPRRLPAHRRRAQPEPRLRPGLVASEWADFGWYALGMLGGAVAGLVYEYVFQTPQEEEAPAEAHAA